MRSGSGAGPLGRVDSSHTRRSLRRTPSSGVGTTAKAPPVAVARLVRTGAATAVGSGSGVPAYAPEPRPVTFGRDQLADGGGHLAGEPAQVVGVVAAEDEGADAVRQCQLGQLLDPLLGGPVQEAAPDGRELAGDVEQPAHVLRGPAGLPAAASSMIALPLARSPGRR